MIWGLVALAAIVVGLPVIAWLSTRGMARRPAAPLKPYHDRMDQWMHQQYGLGWADCRPIRKAVAEGSRVTDPALEDAAHQLAAATLSGKAPGVRRVRLASRAYLVLGVVVAASGIVALASGADLFSAVLLLAEGGLFFALRWIIWAYTQRRQRGNAARALELNRPAAHRGT